jgi:RNA polymerase sigma-70 factor (ECF subfamily)
MMAATAAPLMEFTPYLLSQTGLRASLLRTSFQLAADDWEDMRQEMVLDCLRRLPRFNASRGDWRGFVRGVVRNHACVLATRRTRCREFQSTDCEESIDVSLDETAEARTGVVPDFRPALEFSLDLERIIARLPEESRTVARYLAEMPISAICRRTGLSRHRVGLHIALIRAVLEAAGFTGKRGGCQ